MSLLSTNPESSHSTFADIYKPVPSATSHEQLLETLYRFIAIAEEMPDAENMITMYSLNTEVLDLLIKMDH